METRGEDGAIERVRERQMHAGSLLAYERLSGRQADSSRQNRVSLSGSCSHTLKPEGALL